MIGRAGKAICWSVAATAWTSVTLAEFGRFRADMCMLAGLIAGLLAWWRTSHDPDPPEHRWAVGIAMASLALALPPSERLLGGWDPGVYLHSAAQVARTGGLRWEITDFIHLSPLEKETLLRHYGGGHAPFQGNWFLPDGAVAPQFFHLYPCVMAVAWRLGGVWGALSVNPLLNAGCILLFYALARRVVGGRWALAAAALLALNPAQLWQARFPTAEMLTQFLLLAGIWSLARGSWLAGPAFGLALLCRYDTIMFLVPMAACLVVFRPDRGRRLVTFGSLLLVLPFAAQAWWHQQTLSPDYHPASDLVGRAALALTGLLAVSLALLDAPGLRLRDRLAAWTPWLHRAAALALLLGAAWSWFVRPRGTGTEDGNFLYLVDLFGEPGVILALIGIVLWLAESEDAWRRAWLYAGLAVIGVLVWNLFNDHFLMWAARRFIPVAVPLLCAAMVFAARRMGRVGAAVLAAAVAWHISATASVARTRDWPGLTSWMRSVAEHVPADARLYCDQPGFAAPLRFLFDRRAFEVHTRAPNRRSLLADVIFERRTHGHDQYWLTMSGPLGDSRLIEQEVGRFPLETWELQSSKRGVPRERKPRGGEFVLYRIPPSG